VQRFSRPKKGLHPLAAQAKFPFDYEKNFAANSREANIDVAFLIRGEIKGARK